jgi:hypothetical protein
MKCLLFKKEDVEALLKLSAGEVQRYKDIIATLPENSNPINFETLKSIYEGRVMTFEEMLRFGKEIDYDE